MTNTTTSALRMVACDLGAESGRVILGCLESGTLKLEEIHRFPSPHVLVNGGRRWNVLSIFSEILVGLKKCAALEGTIHSVSFDSWGVDYVLLKGNEPLLCLPFHYRDDRTLEGFARAFERISQREIFEESGIQFMTLNTLYQLHDDVLRRPDILQSADGLLLIADYFNWLLSGKRAAEESLASTTQIYNPRTRKWSDKIVAAMDFPARLLPSIIPSGTILGPLRKDLASECDLPETKVVASCSHDTASAVAAVPAEGDDWAYLSSGTWSLLGVELDSPCINEKVRSHNFTNEIGFGGTVRFLKNLVGLWILQELRRTWRGEGKDYSYAELTSAAEASEPLQRWIDPADPRFARPDDMPEKVADFCLETGQTVPESPGDYVRCVLESLAFAYRQTLEELETLTGKNITRLHIVGGGTNNSLLNQMAASATGRTVLAGPVEATAIGNILIQSIALQKTMDLGELRQIVRQSFPVRTYLPQDVDHWTEAYHTFRTFTETPS